MPRPSRIDAARKRASGLKRVLVAVAAIAFVGAGVLARATHPGQATTRSRSTSLPASTQTPSYESGDQSESDDGGFAIAPSTAQPQVQTGVS
jgi:hypothetical protein